MARGMCSECDRDRDLCAGMCRTCRQVCLDVDDGESPSVLSGRWVPNGRGTLVYVEQVAS